MPPVPSMTWKSTALLAGATTLATWLAAPPQATTNQSSAAGPTSSQRFATSEIESEAAKLGARLRAEVPLTLPARNPFRFDTPPPVRPNPASTVPEASSALPNPQPDWPAARLTGLAEETVEGTPQRTAIFSSANGVLLVREGETILDQYRVTRIDGEGVDVTRLDDGSSRRLTLAP
jgi:hypothetical protein